MWHAILLLAFQPVVDRDFSLDLTVGTVLGSIRTIGMGGASVALVEEARGMGANAAAPAVRPATSNDRLDWDGSLDWLNPDLGDDFDNNGQSDADGHAGVLSAGLTFEAQVWGFGVDIAAASREVDGLEIDAVVARVLVARSFADDVYTFGLGLRGGSLTITAGEEALVETVGWSGTAGFLWRPKPIDLRVGASFTLPMTREVPACASCTLTIPARVRLPWELAVGAAWRFGPTRWNRQVEGDFRDERAATVALDLVLIGPMDDAHGIQRWIGGELQPSGRQPALSVRGGGEVEAIPGWLRVRAGSYWEPGRLEGAPGRVHGTFGVEARLFAFRLLGLHRLRLSLTIDAARAYGNGGLSVGFW